MDIIPSTKPWVLMSAEAALGRKDRVEALCELYDVIIVPGVHLSDIADILKELEQKNGQQNQVLRDAGPSDGNN